MKKFCFSTLLLLLFVLYSTQAQELTVESVAFGTGVENRELMGADTVFANTVENVFCFTYITGAQDTTTITHIWYYNNEEKARVDLSIRSSGFRTWSSKQILPSWTGNWSVDILDPTGEVLETKSFTVREESMDQN